MSNVPSWWAALLLSLAAWRIFRLIAEDTILDRPRRRLLRLGDWTEESGDDPPDSYRWKWGIFITCPYCAGFWISLVWYLAWVIFPTETLVASSPLAINSIMIAAAKLDEKANE